MSQAATPEGRPALDFNSSEELWLQAEAFSTKQANTTTNLSYLIVVTWDVSAWL